VQAGGRQRAWHGWSWPGLASVTVVVCASALAATAAADSNAIGSARAEGDLSYVVEYSGSYTDHTVDQGYHTYDTKLDWDMVLRASVSIDGRVTRQPVRFTVSGTQTVVNTPSNEPGITVSCEIVAGAPLGSGDILLTAASRPKPNDVLASYDTFEASAAMPLGAHDEVTVGAGSDPACSGPVDLSPVLSASAGVALPPSWNSVETAQASGTPTAPVRKRLAADFTVSGPDGETDTVHVSALFVASVQPPACPTKADTALLAEISGAFDETVKEFPRLVAVKNNYYAFVKRVRANGKSTADQLAEVNARTPGLERDLRAAYQADLSNLAKLERGWLARANCTATRTAITSKIDEARDLTQQQYENDLKLPAVATDAVKDNCGCGGFGPVAPK
jgi:hypothetical protein